MEKIAQISYRTKAQKLINATVILNSNHFYFDFSHPHMHYITFSRYLYVHAILHYWLACTTETVFAQSPQNWDSFTNGKATCTDAVFLPMNMTNPKLAGQCREISPELIFQ